MIWAAAFATTIVAVDVAAILIASRYVERFERAELVRPLALFNVGGVFVLAVVLWRAGT